MSITFDPKGIWRNRKLRLLQLVHDLKSMFSKSQLNSCITIFELNKHNMPWLIKCLMLFCRYLFSSLSCLRDLDMMTMFLGEFDTFNTLTMSGTKLPGEFDTFFLSSPCLPPRFGSSVNGQWLGMLTVGSGIVLLPCLLWAHLTGDNMSWKTVGWQFSDAKIIQIHLSLWNVSW